MPAASIVLGTREKSVFGLTPERGRWGFILVGLAINLCLGAVYAYSIFKPAVEKVYGVNAFLGNLPFMTFLFSFALTMFFGGRFLERVGPRLLALGGGLIVGLGWILSSYATSIWMLVLTYGVIAGSGVGLVYGCPVAMGARWFPDRKGLAVGLMLAGFGGSALITGRIASLLIGDHTTLPLDELARSLPHTFLCFGVAFAGLLSLLSLPFRFPAAGWRPQGWTPPAAAATTCDLDGSRMLKNSMFWGLFLCYMIGCLAGLMAIGISKPVGSDVIKIASGTTTSLVGVFAVFNAVGRPLFGWLADRLSPRTAAVINLSIILAMSLTMLCAGENTTALYVAAFAGFWLCLGGWLAIAPAATATFFGMAHYSRNYGTVFFAYGLGAILGGIISGHAKDWFGSYTYAFIPTAGLAALGIVIAILFLGRPTRAV
ncbi:MAG: OFA family MFS transporter [Planctomycetia bacterium]|jgi:MFS family permease